MKNFVNLETFRCSCTGRQERCYVQFTRINAFAPMLKTLERKNPGGVTLETIAANAICPIHQRMLTQAGRADIVRLDQVVAEFSERARKAREEERQQQHFLEEKARRRKRWFIANTSDFSLKLKQALKQ